MSQKRFRRGQGDSGSWEATDPRGARNVTLEVVAPSAPGNVREEESPQVGPHPLDDYEKLLFGAPSDTGPMGSLRRRDSLYRRALAVADIAAAAAALGLSIIFLGGDRVTVPLIAVIPL